MPAHRKYKLTKKEALPWALQFESASNYLAKLNSLKDEAALNLFHFCDWSGLVPDALLALKSSFDSLDAENLLDRFVFSPVKLPDSTKWHVVQTVRGFFRVNYRALQPQAGKMEYTNEKPQRFPSKAQRYDLYKACYNLRDRFLIMAATCSAIALDTLDKLRWFHFEQDWMRQSIPHISIPSELLKGHGKGKFRGVRQETFLTPEAKRVAVEYRDWLSKTFRHSWSEDDYVFLCVKANAAEPLSRVGISRAISEVSERAGVNFGSHDGRRIVQTALESVGASPQWIKKIKGRKVSGEENPYSKPAIEQLRQKYREALPELEFLAESSKRLAECEIERLQGENKDLIVEKQTLGVVVRDLSTQQKELEQKVKGMETVLNSDRQRLLDWMAELLKDPEARRRLFGDKASL